MKKNFQAKIKELRLKKGLTQKQLSEITNLTPALISLYESGKQTPRAETVERLASALECSVYELLEHLAETPKDDLYEIPFLTSDSVLHMEKSFLKKISFSIRDLFGYLVLGDSMSPTLNDGDTVIIDTSQTELNELHLFAVQRNYKVIVIKRLVRNIQAKWVYQSDNPNKMLYPDMYPLEDDKIVGRVIWRSGTL